jgi:RNA polymerase sigma-70 factor, ECF subfamily
VKHDLLLQSSTLTASLSDAELAVLALHNPDSFIHIVNRFEKPLLRYLRRLMGSHGAAADDVLQEAFIKAYVNLNDFDQGQPLSPWLYRIAHNEAISFLRKMKSDANMLRGPDADQMLERIAAAPEAGGQDFSDADNAYAAEGLRQLDGKYRDVMVLRFLEEKSYREIGDILHLPPGTVATLIRRGLDKLRRMPLWSRNEQEEFSR